MIIKQVRDETAHDNIVIEQEIEKHKNYSFSLEKALQKNILEMSDS